jgi:hypothetical protein
MTETDNKAERQPFTVGLKTGVFAFFVPERVFGACLIAADFRKNTGEFPKCSPTVRFASADTPWLPLPPQQDSRFPLRRRPSCSPDP